MGQSNGATLIDQMKNVVEIVGERDVEYALHALEKYSELPTEYRRNQL
jgi:hypothetical protein